MKTAIYIVSGIGGIVGAYIPTWLWGADMLDAASLLGGFVGTIVGLWLGYVIAKKMDL